MVMQFFLYTSRVELLFPLTMRESKLNGYDYMINPLGVHPGCLASLCINQRGSG